MKKILISAAILIGAILFFLSLVFGDSVADTTPLLRPYPKKITLHKSTITLDKDWFILSDLPNEQTVDVADYLRQNLKADFGLDLPVVRKGNVPGNRKAVSVTVDKGISEINDESYIIDASVDGVKISSKSPKGVFYGIQTLFQLLRREEGRVLLPGCHIEDWPDIKIRAIHFSGAKPSQIKSQLDIIAKYKYNAVIIESQDFFDLKNVDRAAAWKEAFEFARNRFIEPIPDLQSFGTSEAILRQQPSAAEGVYSVDEPFEFGPDGIARPTLPVLVDIENPNFENGMSGWQFGRGWTVDRDSVNGKYSAKITVGGQTPIRSDVLMSQNYSVVPNSVYSVSFWCKVNNTGGNYPPALRVVELDSGGDRLNQHDLHITNTEWERKELNFITGPACHKVYIYCNIWDGYGEAWFDSISLKRMNNSLVNVIRTNQSDIVVKNETGTVAYKKGVDYKVINGQMTFPYFSDSKPFTVKRTSGSIGYREKVLISYDFAITLVPSAGWSVPYCPSEELTYSIMSSALSEVVNLLNPKFISIGHDEIRGMNRDSRCRNQKLANSDILARDIRRIYNIIKGLDPEIRILMSDDMLNPLHNGGNEDYQIEFGGIKGATYLAVNSIPKDIMIMIWWYDAADALGKMKNSPGYFRSKGFDYLVAAWKDKKNIEEWSQIAAQRHDCRGFIVTNWEGFEKNLPNIKYAAELMWSLKRK